MPLRYFRVGAVGDGIDQITGDSGSGDKLGSFVSHMVGIGPQVGQLFSAWGLNLKGQREFDASARPSGYNVWSTLSFSPEAPTPARPNQ